MDESQSNCLIITDPICTQHLTGRGHPESPARYRCISSAISNLCPLQETNRQAAESEIQLCHSSSYLSILREDIEKCEQLGLLDGSFVLSTGDVTICPESYLVARRAVGSVLTGVDKVLEKKSLTAFCLIRPPGHHAEKNRGMGFCLLNNVAIGARYAQKTYGIKRVLIIDWDVHHGNGTQEIFYSDPSVFYFSTHQFPLYPGTGLESERGEGAGLSTTCNCPIAASQKSREDVFYSFEKQLLPKVKDFSPELIMISAGFDAHVDDPLGGFNLTDEDFYNLTLFVKEIALNYTEGKIVSVLEGGYNLDAIASAAKEHVKALGK